jgi:hypothetical protein
MRFEIPAPLTVEHHQLHMQLAKATAESSAVGEAAREVARLLHPHFVNYLCARPKQARSLVAVLRDVLAQRAGRLVARVYRVNNPAQFSAG